MRMKRRKLIVKKKTFLPCKHVRNLNFYTHFSTVLYISFLKNIFLYRKERKGNFSLLSMLISLVALLGLTFFFATIFIFHHQNDFSIQIFYSSSSLLFKLFSLSLLLPLLVITLYLEPLKVFTYLCK